VIRDKNPRKQVLVEHQRLGDIIGGFYEEKTYQSQIFSQGTYRPKPNQRQTYSTHTTKTPNPRLRGSNSSTANARTNSTSSRNGRKTPATKPISKPIVNRKASDNTLIRNRNTENIRKKSTESITKQILSRRGKAPYKNQTEVVKSFNNSRIRNQPNISEKKTTYTITKIVLERSNTFSEIEPRKKKLNSTLNEAQTITAISRIREYDNIKTDSPKRNTKSTSKPKRDTKSESKPKRDTKSESKPKKDNKSESKSKKDTKSESKPKKDTISENKHKKESKPEKKKEEPVANNKTEKMSIRQKYKHKH
jgi:hypothetical protein